MKFFLTKIVEFVKEVIASPKNLKKKLLKDKFENKKYKLKNVRVSMENLVKEKIEKSNKMQN